MEDCPNCRRKVVPRILSTSEERGYQRTNVICPHSDCNHRWIAASIPIRRNNIKVSTSVSLGSR